MAQNQNQQQSAEAKAKEAEEKAAKEAEEKAAAEKAEAEAKAKAEAESNSAKVKLINKTSGIRRVLNRRIMPDDDGIEITKDEFDALKKGKAFQAQLAAKEFEVK